LGELAVDLFANSAVLPVDNIVDGFIRLGDGEQIAQQVEAAPFWGGDRVRLTGAGKVAVTNRASGQDHLFPLENLYFLKYLIPA